MSDFSAAIQSNQQRMQDGPQLLRGINPAFIQVDHAISSFMAARLCEKPIHITGEKAVFGSLALPTVRRHSPQGQTISQTAYLKLGIVQRKGL